jgi:hypothetical protein
VIEVREERPEDRPRVREVEEAAFGRPDEADIDDTRFGFRPAGPMGVTNQWAIDDPAWMMRGSLPPGEVRFPAAFGP